MVRAAGLDYVESKQSLTCHRTKAKRHIERLDMARTALAHALEHDSAPATEPEVHPLPDADDVRRTVMGIYTETRRARELAVQLGIGDYRAARRNRLC